MNQDTLVAGAAAASGLALAASASWPVFDNLLGAALGACLVISRQQGASCTRKLTNLLLSAGVGLLFAPMVHDQVPQLTGGIAAFGCALLVIPLSVKLRDWVRRLDIEDILRRFRGS
ncbi:hypothetical protein IFT75_17825 [Pseudomonas sp. CFBP 8758]|uniref:Phage holin n=1 Tax=Pseudomonas baltica TaxID=2762576 RepID=A0A7X1G3U0_9PSED|nr:MULTISPECIES: hypothetical protein [Pseudomonas]MBC2677199.1 hypothetical protein [Pseudomonas baltica]MBD8595279.1 hypothetical protein [Pseudomonas sp. CFBP 8758]